MDPTKLLRASTNGKVEWNTTRCVLPVAYYPLHITRCILPVACYPLHIAEYATVILASDWLYFSRHGINGSINVAR